MTAQGLVTDRIVPHGDRVCGAVKDACHCMKRLGHDGSHACVHGYWLNEHNNATGWPVLTKQQARAMRAFLWRDTYDEEACDGAVWDRGVRPWPTMDNLAKKGLVTAYSWLGPEEGWLWRLTDLGCAYMVALTSEVPA